MAAGRQKTGTRKTHWRVAIVDLGCAKNTIDSESALGALLEAGFAFAADVTEADLVLINTCGFINSAKEESIANILEITAHKQDNPGLKIAAMGCLVQRYGEELSQEVLELDGLLGFSAYNRLADNCKKIMAGKRVVSYQGKASLSFGEGPRLLLTGKAYAYLRIAEGCDNRCAYCAVPLIRGSYRSRSAAAILREAEALVKEGARELCLVAQDTAYYGADRTGKPRLGKLLRKLLQIPGKPWIRLLYAHPAHLDDDTIALLASEEQLLHYLDLPIQHINTRILKRMGRKVTRQEIEKLISRLRARIPELTLRTSLITGFPGETEADFKELQEFVAEGHFQHLGVFSYSREEDTAAYRMKNQVPEALGDSRAEALMKIQQGITFAWLDSRLGQTVPVLVEQASPGGGAFGRSSCEAPEVDGEIIIPNGDFYPGQIIPACLRLRNHYDLMADA
ncbi:MAG: 30S ribosomal protein S12 methylthiotransferase RimO [Planctomycetes bacterium]|nr:30S ribosomal protein S12 methylthiotransferase RimO [Planctomycetota bacterium]